MTAHGRKYGERPSHPIYVWNGLLEAKHRQRIGPAIWEFLWCINAVTFERDGKGFVLGGAPVNFTKIADGFDVNEQTIRLHFELLEKWSYIERTRTPRGYSIRVRNSAKFTRKPSRSDREGIPDHNAALIGKESPNTPTKIPDHSIKNPRSNKIKQLDKAIEQAASRSAVWDFLGVSGSRWPSEIQEVCSTLYRNKNGQTPVEFVGACMDGISVMGARIPSQLAQRAAELRAAKKQSSQEEIPELEAEPWAK